MENRKKHIILNILRSKRSAKPNKMSIDSRFIRYVLLDDNN